jgi:hypothetical protein
LSHLYIKCIILPRQARDKHRESTQKMAVFCRRVVRIPQARSGRQARRRIDPQPLRWAVHDSSAGAGCDLLPFRERHPVRRRC